MLACACVISAVLQLGCWLFLPRAAAHTQSHTLTHSAAPHLQATKEEGAYANGRVHVELLPAEVYGAGCEKQFSLRRLEGVLTEAEQQEHVQREMLKVGARLLNRSAVCGVAAVQLPVGAGVGGVAAAATSGATDALFTCAAFGPCAHPPAGAQLAAHRAHALHHGTDARVLCGCVA